MTQEQGRAIALARARRRRAVGARMDDAHEGTAQERLIGAQAPVPEDYGVLASALQGAGQGVTLGFGDEIMAGLKTGAGLWGDYGAEVENQRAGLERAREAHPFLYGAGEVAGSIAPVAAASMVPGGAVALGARAPSLFAGTRLALPARSVASAASGAAIGATSAAGHGEDPLQAALIGTAVGGAIPAIGQVAGGIARNVGARRAAAELPTTRDIRASGREAYRAAEQTGTVFSPGLVNRVAAALAFDARRAGFNPGLHPGIGEVFREVGAVVGQPLGIQRMMQLRRLVRAGNNNATNRDQARIVKAMVDRFDDIMDKARPSDFLAGDDQTAVQKWREARQLWAQARRSEVLDDVMGRIENAANPQMAVRTEFRALLNNKRLIRSFNPEEKRAIAMVVRGAPLENALTVLGRFAIRGPVSGAMNAGTAMLGGVKLATGAAAFGEVGRRTAAALARRNVRNVESLVRSGQPALPPGAGDAVDAATVRLLQGTATPNLPRAFIPAPVR